MKVKVQFSSVQSLSRVQFFATPWITACQASLSITNSRNLPKPTSIESAMPSSHLIFCHPLLLSPILPSIRVFSNESILCMRWPKYWSFSFNISPSNEHPGLISFRMDWLDLLAVQKEESETVDLKLNFQKTNIMASGPINSWQIDMRKWKQSQTLFSWAPKSLWMVTSAMKLKDTCSWKKSYDKSRQHIKKQRYHFADRDLYSLSYGFPSSHIQMWELDHKEDWVLMNWCFWTVVLEKTLEGPLDSKKIKSVNPKGNKPWIFIERTDA